MSVFQTRSERVLRSRRTLLEMLAASVDLSEAPGIQALLNEYSADLERFPGAVRRAPEPVGEIELRFGEIELRLVGNRRR